jgi:hypothetical protein
MEHDEMSNYPHPKVDSVDGRLLVAALHLYNFPNHRIGALFDENAGRVSEALDDKKRRRKRKKPKKTISDWEHARNLCS